MAVRVMGYVALLYQDLIRRRELTPTGKLPAVLPLVLYNGLRRWWARWEVGDLVEPRPLPARAPEAVLPEVAELQEVKTMLEETARLWPKKWKAEGLQEGRREGRVEGRRLGLREGEAQVLLRLLRQKFGPLDRAAQAQIEGADRRTLRRWERRLLAAQSLAEVLAP